ncbi:MAG: hypothetical protein AAFQ09_07455 [Pseudomonadota bacterium]
MTLIFALELLGWTIIAIELAGRQGQLERALESFHSAISAVVYPLAALLLFDKDGHFDGQKLLVIGLAIGALIYVPGSMFYQDQMVAAYDRIMYGDAFDREMNEFISGPMDTPGLVDFGLLAAGTLLIVVGVPALFLFLFARYPGGMIAASGFCLALTSSIAARVSS